MAIILLGLFVSSWMGPFWVFPRVDPDYAYLLNGLNIVQGHRSWHADHPGTPVQMLVGGVISTAHKIAGLLGAVESANTRRDVIARPEFYLRMAHIAILSLAAISSFFLGLAALRASRSLPCALATQVMCVATVAIIAAIIRVNPEPMLLVISMLLGAAAILVCTGPSRRGPGSVCPGIESEGIGYAENPRPRSRAWSVLLGVLLGVGIATKITFAPAALICLAAVRGRRQWGVLALSTAIALAIATSPIWSRLRYIRDWVWKNMQGSGRYGDGEKMFIDTATYPSALLESLRYEPALPALLAISVLAVLIVTAGGWFQLASPRALRLRTLLAGIVGMQVAIILVMAKSSEPRYLVPAMAMMGPALCIIWMLTAGVPRWSGRVLRTGLGIGVIATAGWGGVRLLEWRPELIEHRERALQSARIASEHPESMIAYLYGDSSEAFALLFGCQWSQHRYNDLVLERFPNSMAWSAPRWFYTRLGEDLTEEQFIEWAQQGRLIVGAPYWPLPEGLELEPIVDLGRPAGAGTAGRNALGTMTWAILNRGATLYRVSVCDDLATDRE